MNKLEETHATDRPGFPVELLVGLVPEAYPPPHARYVVKRGSVICTATPCYGMHHPWWVVSTFGENAEPVSMRDGDEWQELKPNAELTRGEAVALNAGLEPGSPERRDV